MTEKAKRTRDPLYAAVSAVAKAKKALAVANAREARLVAAERKAAADAEARKMAFLTAHDAASAQVKSAADALDAAQKALDAAMGRGGK